MLERVAPQRAEDRAAGVTIQVGDRYSMQFLSRDINASVEVDFGPVTALYPETLKASRKDGSPISLTPAQRSMILEYIQQGLRCMGVTFEILPGRS